MPYHSVAIGLPWEKVQTEYQILIIALMRVVGGAFIACALAMCMILIYPFRQGQRWAHYTVPITGLIGAGAALYSTLYVKKMTYANTPWLAAGIPVAIFFIGLLITLMQKSLTKRCS